MQADHPQDERPRASFVSSCASLMKTMLGSGTLAMPSVLAAVGIVPGMAMIALAMTLSVLGQCILAAAAAEIAPLQSASIHETLHNLSPFMSVVFDVAVVVKALGVSTSYFMVIGDSIAQLAEPYEGVRILFNRNVWITVSLLLVVPLSLKTNLDALKRTSIAGILVTLYLVGTSAHLLIMKGGQSPEGTSYYRQFDYKAITSAFAIFVFGFTCHQNTFHVFNESADRSPKGMRNIIAVSVVLTAVIYAAFALVTYLTFGSDCSSNIFETFPNDAASQVARLGFIFLASSTIPLQMHPLRMSLRDVIATLNISPSAANEEGLRTGITIAAIMVSYTLAITTSNLRNLLSTVGRLAGVPVCYFLPFTIYHLTGSVAKTRPFTIGSIIMAVLGILIMAS